MNNKNRKEKLKEIKYETKTLILYEAPHKLKETLKDLRYIIKNRRIVLAHEITKIHESFESGNIDEIIEKVVEPKGEYVIIIEKNKQTISEEELNELSVEEHYKYYEKLGYENKDIIKQIAKDRNVQKNEIYKQFIKTETKIL